MGFHVFVCTIAVIPVPPGKAGGGGGGSYATNEFLVPFPNKLKQTTRMVLITVKMGDRSWRKSYTVLREKAEIIIRVMNFVNTVRDRMYVGVDTIKKASKRVTAVFNRKDK